MKYIFPIPSPVKYTSLIRVLILSRFTLSFAVVLFSVMATTLAADATAAMVDSAANAPTATGSMFSLFPDAQARHVRYIYFPSIQLLSPPDPPHPGNFA